MLLFQLGELSEVAEIRMVISLVCRLSEAAADTIQTLVLVGLEEDASRLDLAAGMP